MWCRIGRITGHRGGAGFARDGVQLVAPARSDHHLHAAVAREDASQAGAQAGAGADDQGGGVGWWGHGCVVVEFWRFCTGGRRLLFGNADAPDQFTPGVVGGLDHRRQLLRRRALGGIGFGVEQRLHRSLLE